METRSVARKLAQLKFEEEMEVGQQEAGGASTTAASQAASSADLPLTPPHWYASASGSLFALLAVQSLARAQTL